MRAVKEALDREVTELHDGIQRAVSAFQTSTGITVEAVSLIQHYAFGSLDPAAVVVSIDLKR